jgi:hypothetical protein
VVQALRWLLQTMNGSFLYITEVPELSGNYAIVKPSPQNSKTFGRAGLGDLAHLSPALREITRTVAGGWPTQARVAHFNRVLWD